MLSSSYVYQEIHEQPDVLARLFEREQETARRLADAIAERGITHIVIAARGTSDNAARYAKYVLGMENSLPVLLAAPSMFTIYHKPPRFERALVIGISQSGKSPDIVSVVAEARRQGALTAVITNTPGSDLAQQGDFVLDLGAGQERAVAATKTYTASLGAIAMLSAALSGDDAQWAALHSTPDAVKATLTVDEQVADLVRRYRYMSRSVVTGRGYHFATAYEIALKLKEMTYTIVEPYSSADFLHGPIAMIEDGFPVMVVASQGAMLDTTLSFMQTLVKHRAEIICLSDAEEALAMTSHSIRVPATLPEWLSPITMVVPGQLFAVHLAHIRGYNVDAPRSIRKVTETE
ncbi:MAG: SIS domain-containing protein [Aggregatilineales bacterium]|nr:SIS domain-containing protein [Chloroflexota bacterium]HOA22974.1 SIS domain-containing protein [Aggregatilineales bacterium]HPV08133.1 SIS domain-containing protein [Aggregatilineales bacterium]HQE19085.1 SIS domain-containing protein [Aggregatilineales bacterium]